MCCMLKYVVCGGWGGVWLNSQYRFDDFYASFIL